MMSSAASCVHFFWGKIMRMRYSLFKWPYRKHFHPPAEEKCPYVDLYQIISTWSSRLSTLDVQALIEILAAAINRGDAGRKLLDEIDADTVRKLRTGTLNRKTAVATVPGFAAYIALVDGCNSRDSIPFLLAALDSKVAVRADRWAAETTEGPFTIEPRWTPQNTSLTDGWEVDQCGHKGRTMTRLEITRVYRDYPSDPLIARSALTRLTHIGQLLNTQVADPELLLAKAQEIEQRGREMIRVLHEEKESVLDTFWDGDSGYW
ncbi:MAG: hypothetical protein A4E62_01760 [Syntrophorhabdus sp. PtaU1.Bin002]|nr:MAG: hypothetical protein A4E62_01760 [Syntrophorhabdus sp. PtaU1.Bin002]